MLKRYRSYRLILFLPLQISFATCLLAQTPPREAFNIVFENNFNNNQAGSYQFSDYYNDWNGPSGNNRQSLVDMVPESEGSSNKFMRGYFPQGTYSPDNGGWSWNSPISGSREELYFSYDIRFKPGFQWVLGGKIPGLTGGHVESGTLPEFTDGFSVRMMWKENGKLVFYVYHHDQSIVYGSSHGWGDFQFTTGQWYNITFRLVLNKVQNGSGVNNGILEGFVDGKLKIQLSNFRFRNIESIFIDNMYICSFFGGSSEEWSAQRDEWIDTDNYIVYSYAGNTLDVPRGQTLSSWSKTLLHPYHQFLDDDWKKSLRMVTASASTATLAWSNYPVLVKYALERRESESTVFQTIANLTYGTTQYADNTLSAGKTYFYRLRAYNESGVSVYSNTVQSGSPQVAPPQAPTELKNLSTTEKSISVSWSDNSSNEAGFEITRTLAADPGESTVVTVEANDTAYTDKSVTSGTTYVYTVRAVNAAGSSANSNKTVIAALTEAEKRRIKEGLIAYYNFGYNPDNIVYDQSGYGEPLNLKVLQPSAIVWDKDHRLDMVSSTALVSYQPATKITNAVKQSGEITVECWIYPFQPGYSAKTRILSLGKNDQEIGFVLDQEFSDRPDGKSLEFTSRTQTEATNPSGYPELMPDDPMLYLKMTHLTYVRDSLGRETIYMNGEKAAEGFRPSGFSTWKNDFYLRLGNESDLNHPWKGTYYAVAIYDKALTLREVLNNYSAGPYEHLEDKGIEYDVNLYPNPVQDLATLEIIPVNIEDDAPLTLFRIADVYGKIHHQEYLFNPYQQVIKTMDFTRFPKGMYFIQVISGENTKTAKVVVQ